MDSFRHNPRRPHPLAHGLLAALCAGLLLTGLLLRPWIAANAPLLDAFTVPIRSDASPEAQTAAAQAARDLALQVQAEGAVLLRNENDTLPLPPDLTRVNVFGWAATQWLGGGSGSGGVADSTLDLLGALAQYGITYNTELIEMYRAFQPQRNYPVTLHASPAQACQLYEPSITDRRYYSDSLLANAAAFSDTALLVIGRPAGESNDCTQVQYKRTEADGPILVDESRTYLHLSTEEEALLAYLGQTYARVILVLNTANPLALGPVETIPGVDSCLLVGYSGEAAAAALPALLWGAVSPSGRTADTFAYDFASAPGYATSAAAGVGRYTNANGLYPLGQTCPNLSEPSPYEQVSFVDYAESIYVGYAWYETADAMGFWDGVRTPYGDGYAGVVQYPFGYGLSYTDFTWSVLSAPGQGQSVGADQDLSFTVQVTNTGTRPGQDVVQLYGAAPWQPGGIEKSAAVLLDFAKTDLLAPGESQTLTLTAALSDLVSYDCYDTNRNGFTGYELDPGDYLFRISRDAHTPVETVSVHLSAGVPYPQDPVTGLPVGNKFTGPTARDGVSLDGSDTEQHIRWLSRTDFAGTWPQPPQPRAMHPRLAARNLDTDAAAQRWASANPAQPLSVQDSGLRIEENGQLTPLGWALGADPHHPQWEPLLAQIPVREMEQLVFHAYSHTAPLPSVGKPLTKDADGPAQIGGFAPERGVGVGFPAPAVLAQTWNEALARQVGRSIGHQAALLGYTSWYAPAVNLHRTPFGGRNYEYYSEDALFSGRMAGQTVAGSQEAGTACFVKHFICNDQESGIYRDGIYTWMTEQTLRELYLKPFFMLVTDYDATGLMTAYNRIGGVWAGGSEALLTGILREEWGFAGAVLTDYSDHRMYMNGGQMLRAGGDLWMDGIPTGQVQHRADGPAWDNALRESTRHILYHTLHARVVNRDYVAATGDTALLRPVIRVGFAWWRVGVCLGAAGLALLLLGQLHAVRRDLHAKRAR